MLTDKYISIVVACYRDEGSVTEMLRRLTETMERVTPNWDGLRRACAAFPNPRFFALPAVSLV